MKIRQIIFVSTMKMLPFYYAFACMVQMKLSKGNIADWNLCAKLLMFMLGK